jgi:hypothetical protein
MDLNDNFQKDAEEFTALFRKMDAEGAFDDFLPNTGERYDEEAERASVLRYAKSLDDDEAFSFLKQV